MVVSHLRARALSLSLSRILRFQPRLATALHAHPFVVPHRFLSFSTESSSATFAAEDYLVSRCGLTRAQALKYAPKISHLLSPSRPDAVLAFFQSTLGIPAAYVAKIVAMDPSILCASVEKTLSPRVADLDDLGLSRDEIARLVRLSPNSLRSRFVRSKIEFWLAELGSFDKLLYSLRMGNGLLTTDLDKVVKLNVAFLRQCGFNVSDIVSTSSIYATRLLTRNPRLLKEAVQRVEELGLERGTRMFLPALNLIAWISKEVVARRIRLLHNIGFSKDDVLVIVKKAPLVLGLSEQKVQENMDFLMKDVGLEIPYITRRPVLIMYSVKQRLLPRHGLLKALREKGLLEGEKDYYAIASMAEKIFLQKFVHPFKNNAPGLIDDYTLRCAGKAVDGVSWQGD